MHALKYLQFLFEAALKAAEYPYFQNAAAHCAAPKPGIRQHHPAQKANDIAECALVESSATGMPCPWIM